MERRTTAWNDAVSFLSGVSLNFKVIFSPHSRMHVEGTRLLRKGAGTCA